MCNGCLKPAYIHSTTVSSSEVMQIFHQLLCLHHHWCNRTNWSCRKEKCVIYPVHAIFNPLSAGTVFICQILTSKDGSGTERIKTFLIFLIGIQMKRKELTLTFMMISNFKKSSVSTVYAKKFSVVRDKSLHLVWIITEIAKKKGLKSN